MKSNLCREVIPYTPGGSFMKKNVKVVLSVLFMFLLLVLLVGCACEPTDRPGGSGSGGNGSGSDSSEGGSNDPIEFQDPVFEELVKKALGKEVVTAADLAGVNHIQIGGDHFVNLSKEGHSGSSMVYLFGTDVEFDGVRYTGFGSMTSLADLKQFKDLTFLSITLQPNIDYSTIPAEVLPKLRTVFLTQSSIKDLSFLKGASSMFSLELFHNEVTDLTPLADCKELVTISANSNGVTDLSPLAQLPKLKRLSFYQNKVADLTPLANLTLLEELGFYKNQIEDITPLAGLTNLKDLELSNNKIKDVMPLKGFKEVENLNLSGNPVENLEELDHIENIRF